jgi:hypothetical protein
VCHVGDKAKEKTANDDESDEELEEDKDPEEDDDRAYKMYVWTLPQSLHHCNVVLM